MSNSIENIAQEAINWRRHIHQNPELSFKEFKTADYIRNLLNEFEVDHIQEIAKTGTIALIKGVNPDKKCTGFRADIDALPIQEENDVPYKSKNTGIMHACGHDVHTSILLGFAKWACENRSQFEGTLKLLFQPGEEVLPGGASIMIKEKALENPKIEALYGLHVFPEFEAGTIGVKSGMYMASCDELHVRIIGKGGHAAMPHDLIDPILMTTNLINDLQQVVSRNCPAAIPCVLSFGKIIANGATNVIPDEVYLEGTFRTMNEKWRSKAHALILQQAEAIANQFGGKIDFEIRKGYPFLSNDENLVQNFKSKTSSTLGKEKVLDLPIRMTAEDFAYYTHLVPSCFFRLGTGSLEKKITAKVHQSNFDIDEKAIYTGIQCFIALI